MRRWRISWLRTIPPCRRPADALSQSQTEAESANSALQLAKSDIPEGGRGIYTKVTEANEKIAELTDELEKLSDACDEAERNETTAQPALLQQYEEGGSGGKICGYRV